jgi:uncharacterized protein YdbL (DUF1318 family)
MAKAKTTYSILSDEEKARRIARASACVKAEKAAKEAGFSGEPGKGYWKAVRAYCEAKGITYPVRKAKAKSAKKATKARKASR